MDGLVALLHLGAFFIVMVSMMTEDLWRKWWNTSLVASGLMVLFALLQLAGIFTINQGGARVDGTFGNAIYLAVYMLVHIFIAGFMLLREKGGQRWVYGSLMVTQTIILYYTATRGAILGLLGGVVVFALLNMKNKEDVALRKMSLGLLLGLLVLVGGFFLLKDSNLVSNSPVLSRFSSLNISELKSQGRYFVWPMAWEGFKERPILGWGQENFSHVFQKYYRPEMYKLEPWFDRAHNIFLDWLVAGGVLGLVLYLSLYAVPVYLLWCGQSKFSFLEKTVFTSLLSAYFFHNFFVFDHLVSYILFFSVLAYVGSRSGDAEYLWEGEVKDDTHDKISIVVIAVLLVSTLYFINVRPIGTNMTLINALNAMQVGDLSLASKEFKDSYRDVYLGQTEASEQIARNSITILTGNIPMEEKNGFFEFVTNTVVEQVNLHKDSARTLLLAGSYMSSIGRFEESLAVLKEANVVSPGKLDVLFEIGSIYINTNKVDEAMAVFEKAYNMAPGYKEAKVIYLIGAIYAADSNLENNLVASLDRKVYVFDDRIMNAYFTNRRFDKVEIILNERKVIDPVNAATYDKYLQELRNQK